MSDLEAILRWYLTLSVVAIGLVPVVIWIGRGLGSFAYGLVRPVALVVLTWIVWWPAAITGLPFSRMTLLIALLLVACSTWFLWFRREFQGFDLRRWLVFELLWLVSFLGYAWFRSFNPDIINTEKPMEIALLSSVSRSTEVPAPDPWFAGSAINYYYFGYQSLATIIKISGVPAVVAFNLGLATLFASCITVASTIGGYLASQFRMAHRAVIASAVLAPVVLVLSSNLETARRLIQDVRATIDAGWWDGVGWQASRIIVDNNVHAIGDVRNTINEFPAFSFVLGDLHPHVLAYPLLGAVIALALGFHRSPTRDSRLRLLTIGGLVGVLYASNSWDAPAGFAVVVVMLSIVGSVAWKTTVIDTLIVAAGAIVGAFPFLLHFDAPVGIPAEGVPAWVTDLPILGGLVSTLGVVTWRPSSVSEILTVHGLWIGLFAIFAAYELRQSAQYRTEIVRWRHVVIAAGALLFAVAFAWAPAVVLLGVPATIAFWLASRSEDSGTRLVSALFGVGFALALVPEFIYIQDPFGDRMNTVFKLYFQAWLILSVASAAAFVVTIRNFHGFARFAVVMGGVLAILASLAYTPLSAADWTNDFAQRRGLNGMAYIELANADDFAAIAWLNQHASTEDSIVESPGCSYDVVDGVPMNRMSAFTGVPTIIGWSFHEYQWRRGEIESISQILENRVSEANALLSGVPASADEPRFLIIGHQETLFESTCANVTPRDVSVIETLEAAGWVQAFSSGNSYVLVRADDALAARQR